MANRSAIFRVVLESNVLFAVLHSTDPHSSNHELIECWQANEFTLFFSRDTLHEYAEKLLELSVN